MTARRMAGLAVGLVLFASPASSLCVCVTCAFGGKEMFRIASGSMEPALQPDTCAIATYVAAGDPRLAPGAVIVFDHPARPGRFVFRLIGLPGDVVEMKDGVLWLNGAAVPRNQIADYERVYEQRGAGKMLPRCVEPVELGQICRAERFTEILPNGARYDVLNLTDGFLDNTAPVTVPEGDVFVLGDNRDNASDSRVPVHSGGPGLVPMSNIIGVFDP